ncbi:signal peptidase II [Tichowtungia aerotolerans]|uniref:Lipoprotein signal peptidase n=1 Tax=Tichowtungia aerotolerans TaxID=2697043 RepID=A0A6P1M7G3_9BACT|nr:signal peptidase II [Tichowtungia aerotolerans]QHI68118.1 signal peptidase II [Tichowtungia aerotolerans]
MLPILLCLIIVLIDQFSKVWVRSTFVCGAPPQEMIPGFFNLVYVRNPGAAWGMLGGQQAILILLSAVVLILLAVFHRRVLNPTLDHRIALGLMLGGILGNLIDRIKLGWVTDFLDFHIGTHHWPSFNVADSAICVAVGLYLLSSLWHKSHPLKNDS